jgi:hypothetical protein
VAFRNKTYKLNLNEEEHNTEVTEWTLQSVHDELYATLKSARLKHGSHILITNSDFVRKQANNSVSLRIPYEQSLVSHSVSYEDAHILLGTTGILDFVQSPA